MTYTEVIFHDVPGHVKDVLIALLSDDNYAGFEESNENLIAYVPSSSFNEEFIRTIATEYGLKYSVSELADKNWNEVWESNFDPVIVDEFCAIRADFHEAIPGVTHEILITPKMSFGTGHHATTFMMIRQMQEIHFTGKHVLDFGTGTGVLAILASKLHASYVVAIDNDEWSIRNAAENFEANNCSSIKLVQADTADNSGTYNIILANITRNVIADNLSYFNKQLTPGGILLISGLLEDDKPEIVSLASRYQFQLEKTMHRGKWISIRFHKTG